MELHVFCGNRVKGFLMHKSVETMVRVSCVHMLYINV